MKSATLLLLGLFIVLVALFAGSAFDSRFVLDPTFGQAVIGQSVLYERFGDYLADGHYPWFLPEFGGGYPAAAAWNNGLLSPATALFALLPAGPAWTWSTILHLLLAAFGMFIFVRAVGGDDSGAAVAAVVYVLSEFMIGRSIAGQLHLVWPAAWLPFVFLGVRRAARGERGGVALLGLTLGLGLISGDGRLWAFLLPVLLIHAGREALAGADRGRALLRLVVAFVLAGVVSAVQWSATLSFAGVATVDPASVPPVELVSARFTDLVGLVIPGSLGRMPDGFWGGSPIPHEFGAAGGAGVLLLVLLGVVSGLRGRFFWLLTAVLGILLAGGVMNPVSRILAGLPVIDLGVVFGRGLLLTTFAFAVLSGFGATGFLRADRRRRTQMALIAGILLALLIWGALLLLLGYADRTPHLRGPARFRDTALPALLLHVLGLAPVVAGLWLVRRGPRVAIILPMVVAVCVVIAGIPSVKSVDAEAYFRDWAADLPADARPHRMRVLGLGPYPNVERSGWRTLRPISGLDSPWFQEVLGSESNRMPLWMDVRATVAGMSGSEVHRGEAVPSVRVLSLVWPLGRGMICREIRESVPDDEVIGGLGDWSRVLLFPAAALRAREGGVPAAEDAVEFLAGADPNRLSYRVRATAPGWLYLSEKYYPFWRARVDDLPAPCQRVNLAGMAVPIPAGEHRVELRFEPASSRYGPIASLAGFVLCVLLLAAAWRGRVKQGRRDAVTQ